MTAKQIVLEHAPEWSEAQARRALLAAEGKRSARLETSTGGRRDLMEGAAALRARQPEASDAVALVREGRAELERRGL